MRRQFGFWRGRREGVDLSPRLSGCPTARSEMASKTTPHHRKSWFANRPRRCIATAVRILSRQTRRSGLTSSTERMSDGKVRNGKQDNAAIRKSGISRRRCRALIVFRVELTKKTVKTKAAWCLREPCEAGCAASRRTTEKVGLQTFQRVKAVYCDGSSDFGEADAKEWTYVLD